MQRGMDLGAMQVLRENDTSLVCFDDATCSEMSTGPSGVRASLVRGPDENDSDNRINTSKAACFQQGNVKLTPACVGNCSHFCAVAFAVPTASTCVWTAAFLFHIVWTFLKGRFSRSSVLLTRSTPRRRTEVINDHSDIPSQRDSQHRRWTLCFHLSAGFTCKANWSGK